MGSGQQKPQQQQSQQMTGSGQQNPKQNYEIKYKIKIFDYEQFILIMQQGLQMQENEQENSQQQYENSQQLLNQFKCMIVSHKNKYIEGICVNEECTAQNRRSCFDCVIQRIHDNEKQQINTHQLNADQIKLSIENYLQFLNKQIDYLEYCLYFEQLELINENDQKKIDYAKFQELESIEFQMKQFHNTKDHIHLKEYIQQQHNQNIGLFSFLQKYYQEVQAINKRLNDYQKYNKQFQKCFKICIIQLIITQVKNNDSEGFDQLRKKKPVLVQKIMETLQYKNRNKDGDSHYQQNCELEIESYQLQIKSNPKDYEAYFKMGVSLDNLSRHEEAIQMYDKAISLNQKYSIAYNSKGKSLDYLCMHYEAIEMYDRAILLNSQYSQAFNNKGNSFQFLGLHGCAIEMYDKALQLNPDDPASYNNKGVSLDILERYEEAIDMYDIAIQMNHQYQQAYNNKGITLFNLKRYYESILMYDKAILLNPYSSMYYNLKGISLDKLQRHEEAIQIYNKAIQLNPQNPDFYNNKANSLQHLGRHKEVLLAFKQVKEIQNS